jgi:hypothetical protein
MRLVIGRPHGGLLRMYAVTMTKRLLPAASHQVDSIAEAETVD